MRQLPVEIHLPGSYCREIGRIITRWAFVEWGLSQLICYVMDVDFKSGRMAIREPRAEDRCQLLADLVKIKKIKLTTDFIQLQKDIADACRERDALAHGIWVRDPATDQLYLRLTKGSWQPDRKNKVSRKVKPEGRATSVETLRETTTKIDRIHDKLKTLEAEVLDTLGPSRQKSREPTRKAGRRRARSDKTPPSPPLPFPELS